MEPAKAEPARQEPAAQAARLVQAERLAQAEQLVLAEWLAQAALRVWAAKAAQAAWAARAEKAAAKLALAIPRIHPVTVVRACCRLARRTRPLVASSSAPWPSWRSVSAVGKSLRL